MHPFLLVLPLILTEIPPKAADTAEEAEGAQAAADAGPAAAAGPNAAVGEVRHAAAATHANDILLPEDTTDGTSGRRLLFGMIALLMLMLCMNERGQ